MEESLGGFAPSYKSISDVSKQSGSVVIYHGSDDKVVPVSHAKKYKEAIDDAELVVLDDRGHFSVEEFPELVEDIKIKPIK